MGLRTAPKSSPNAAKRVQEKENDSRTPPRRLRDAPGGRFCAVLAPFLVHFCIIFACDFSLWGPAVTPALRAQYWHCRLKKQARNFRTRPAQGAAELHAARLTYSIAPRIPPAQTQILINVFVVCLFSCLRCCPGVVGPNWAPFGPSWPQVVRKLSAVGPKLAPIRPKLAPSWSQVGPCWPQVGPSWPQVGPSWPQVGPSWPQVGPSGPQVCPRWPQGGRPTRFEAMRKRFEALPK